MGYINCREQREWNFPHYEYCVNLDQNFDVAFNRIMDISQIQQNTSTVVCKRGRIRLCMMLIQNKMSVYFFQELYNLFTVAFHSLFMIDVAHIHHGSITGSGKLYDYTGTVKNTDEYNPISPKHPRRNVYIT